MKKFFTLMALCMLSIGMMAEQQVSGVVVDEKNEPIIGASIQVKGGTQGTITDYDGEFFLTVPDDATVLVVSYVGMQTQEVSVKRNVRVVLHEATEVIQEVVVTGYGSVTKGSFAGSAQAVDAENIEKKSPSEISKALAGEVAGVQVVNTSGQPGTNATIRIRGIGSVNASTAPLYVVDGVTYDGDISSIDPGDIASTTILKDATATSLYGSRGANGVIVITTKKGNSGDEGKIEVDVKYGANMHLLPMYEVISDPQEFVEMAWQSIYNSLPAKSYTSEANRIKDANNALFSAKGLPVAYNLWNKSGNALIDGYTGKFYDDVELKDGYKNMSSWEDNLFRVGQKANATVKISGGNEKINYYTSYGYLKDEGYYIGSDYDRFTVRGNLDYKPKKWLKGSMNIAYTYSNLNNPGQGDNMNNGFAYVNGIPPIYPVFLYNEDGTIATDPKTGNYAYDYGMNEGYGRGFGSGINPAGALLYDKQNTKQHAVTATGSLEFTLYTGLKLEITAGAQYVGQNASELTNKYYGDAAGLGRIAKSQLNFFMFEAKELLKYNKDFGDHTIDVMAGHETLMASQSVMVGSKSKIADPNSLELGNAIQMSYLTSYTSSQALESYLAQASYWYKERYGVTANYRADGSSNFAKGHRWGHFGSVGLAWKFTDEDFMASVNEYLNNGKLRFSWGMLGNQEVGSDLYHDMWSIEYVDNQVGIVWSSPGTQDLTWEKTSHFDLGLEFSIMKYLDVELDYFHKTTFDCLMPRYNASSMGYSYTWINGGKISNQGFEFQLNAHAVDTRNVKLDIRWNGGFYRNKVLELPKDINNESEMTTNGGLVVGHSMYEYRMTEFVGVDPETGEALYKAYYDAAKGGFGYTNALLVTEEDVEKGNGSNYISDVNDYRMNNDNAQIRDTVTTRYAYCGADFLGKTAEADLEGGFGFDLEVYGVTLSATCGYRIGGYGMDYTYMMLMGNEKVGNYNWHVDMRDAWTETNTETNIPRLSNGADLYTNSTSTRFLTSNSYLSLNNIRVGYNFPKKLLDKAKIKKLEIYVQGDNLAIATARKGYNPTVSTTGASNSYQYTPLSTVMGGIKIIF